MPSKKLRFTGEFPPIEILEQYPNWEYALDEEHLEGQDETTIRPSRDQTCINPSVAFARGTATLANGTRLPAVLEFNGNSIEGLTVHSQGQWAWSLRRLGKPSTWHAITYEWLPEEERPPTVLSDVGAVFPILVETLLPFASGATGTLTIGAVAE